MGVSQNSRRINTNEVKVSTIIQKSLRKQLKYLKDNIKELYEKYPGMIEREYIYLNRPIQNIYKEREILDSPMGGFWKAMGINDMITEIEPQIQKTTEKGYKKSYRLFEEDMEANGFRYDSQLPIQYMNTFGELNLSNYAGSISKTTKLNVVNILKEGLDNNIGIQEIAKKINGLDATTFSKNRAKLIAVTETGKAYEHGNSIPIKQLESVGVQMLKKWQTVNDSNVRPSHSANENEGRVQFEHTYSATGSKLAPTGVRCRCTMLYDIDNNIRTPQPLTAEEIAAEKVSGELKLTDEQINSFIEDNPRLSRTQVKALSHYTRQPVVNQYYRFGNPNKYVGVTSEEFISYANVLKDATTLAKTKKYNKLYRGLMFNTEEGRASFMESFSKGAEFSDKGIMSTSRTADIVTRMASRDEKYTIKVILKDARGVGLDSISYYPMQKEVIISPNRKFIVESIVDGNDLKKTPIVTLIEKSVGTKYINLQKEFLKGLQLYDDEVVKARKKLNK